ncbi:TnsD family Tn7-like transposition protein [Asaccharospora irregularis]|uniref:Tn7-like transposition protein D n=1 Tax=Asaccharospora irregularis DSM 2635 TaxID=1121321 RepID=A0A1M5RGI8_9FIRM|nr:TnsD family Tn7-like transposition protein [Asaccharospora irregularis]SHH25256.1 Tn7-like transposition protein D [Asaccharospora irregularis DSM 2635]
MLNLFPRIYEGELLYSIISRYKRVAGIVSKKALIKDLYNQLVSLNNLHFPVHIDDLVNNIPPNNNINSEDIIKNNTLYRPFTSFLSEDKAQMIMNNMMKGKSCNPYAQIGLIGSKVKMNDTLLYCSSCIEEDIKEYGESYWRVLHQVPGVLYCKKHNKCLSKSKVYPNRSRVDYICADSVDLSVDNTIIYDDIMDINLKYIENVEYLLRNDINRKDAKFILEIYIDKLRNKGLTSKNGSINIRLFEIEFKSFYGEKYLNQMQSNFNIGSETNWLRLFIRNSNKEKHMLRHLLIIQFLGIRIKDFFEIDKAIGKKEYIYIPNPRLDRDEQREKWIKLINDNPGLSRSEYKNIGRGLYTWMYRNDNEFFNSITPKKSNKNKLYIKE